MSALRRFYLATRIEIAFVIVLYLWLRLERYELRPSGDDFIVFDKWTTQVDRARLTKEPFVKEPAARLHP